MDFKEIFYSTLGEPTDENNLDEYINFVVNNSGSRNEELYQEYHHLLPISKFENYSKHEDNIFLLEYSDHVEAHKLLAKAYPISSFLRPLNFMLNREEKDSISYKELLSSAKQLEWEKFKNSDKYEDYCKQKSIDGRKRFEDPKERQKISERFKSWYEKNPQRKEEISTEKSLRWADDEFRQKTTEKIRLVCKTEEYKRKLSSSSKRMHENRSPEKKEEFNRKMKALNSSEEKRKSNSEIMKIKWAEDEEYKEKMKNRKKRGSSGEKSKALWADPIWRANMLEKRKIAREKRKNETNTN